MSSVYPGDHIFRVKLEGTHYVVTADGNREVNVDDGHIIEGSLRVSAIQWIDSIFDIRAATIEDLGRAVEYHMDHFIENWQAKREGKWEAL